MTNKLFAGLAAFALLGAGPALAAQPVDWQMGFQPASSPVMEDINEFHNMLLVIITTITLLVLALLLYCMIRFNARSNPVPSKTSHNTLIEVVWTVAPILILERQELTGADGGPVQTESRVIVLPEKHRENES